MTKEKETILLWIVLCIILILQGLQMHETIVLKDRMDNVEAAFADANWETGIDGI